MKFLISTSLFILLSALLSPCAATALRAYETEDEEPTVSRKELREVIKSSMAALKAANRGRSLRDSQVEEVEDNVHELLDGKSSPYPTSPRALRPSSGASA